MILPARLPRDCSHAVDVLESTRATNARGRGAGQRRGLNESGSRKKSYGKSIIKSCSIFLFHFQLFTLVGRDASPDTHTTLLARDAYACSIARTLSLVLTDSQRCHARSPRPRCRTTSSTSWRRGLSHPTLLPRQRRARSQPPLSQALWHAPRLARRSPATRARDAALPRTRRKPSRHRWRTRSMSALAASTRPSARSTPSERPPLSSLSPPPPPPPLSLFLQTKRSSGSSNRRSTASAKSS
jgi:hypothetical protein